MLIWKIRFYIMWKTYWIILVVVFRLPYWMSLEKIWKKYEPHASLKSILFQYLKYALNVMNLWIYWLKKEWSKQVFVNQVHWLYLKSHAPNLVVSNILTLIMIRSFTSHCLKVVLISWYKNYMISPKVSIIMVLISCCKKTNWSEI